MVGPAVAVGAARVAGGQTPRVAAGVAGDLMRLGLPPCRPASAAARRLPAAYPVYGVGFEHHMEKVERWVGEQPGLRSFGRLGLFELLEVDPPLRDAITRRAGYPLGAEELHSLAVQHGMHTLAVDGLLKAREGWTTVEEVMRVL